MGRERVTVGELTEVERCHVLNELWEAMSRNEWVVYRSALRPPPPFRALGGGSVPSAQPSTLIAGRGLSSFTLPDPVMGVTRAFAFHLDGAAWEAYRSRLPAQVAADMKKAARRVRALYVRQRTPRGMHYRRNSGRGVTREIIVAMCGALRLCELVVLTGDDIDEYLALQAS